MINLNVNPLKFIILINANEVLYEKNILTFVRIDLWMFSLTGCSSQTAKADNLKSYEVIDTKGNVVKMKLCI